MNFEIENSSVELDALFCQLPVVAWIKMADATARRICLSLRSCKDPRLSRKLKVILFSLNEECPYEEDALFDSMVRRVYTSLSVYKALTDSRVNSCSNDELIRKFFEALLGIIKGEEFQNTFKNEEKVSQRSSALLSEYFINLKLIHSKILIIRLDLYYNQDSIESIACQQNVVKDWQELLAYVRKTFKSHLLGHAMKIEFGIDRGVHVHSIFCMDGSKLKSDVKIAALIGKHWVSNVVPQIGRYFNCNTNSHLYKYKSRCVGLFDKIDEDFKNGVEFMSSYVTKPDPLPSLVIDGLKRKFRKGGLSKKQKKRLKERGEKIKNLNEQFHLTDAVNEFTS